jgi:bacterioferritin-associated ferredoxin
MEEEELPVRACLCYHTTFARLKQIAQERRLSTLEEIARATGCGTGCGLCRPYIARMLMTGEVAFPILPPETPGAA